MSYLKHILKEAGCKGDGDEDGDWDDFDEAYVPLLPDFCFGNKTYKGPNVPFGVMKCLNKNCGDCTNCFPLDLTLNEMDHIFRAFYFIKKKPEFSLSSERAIVFAKALAYVDAPKKGGSQMIKLSLQQRK